MMKTHVWKINYKLFLLFIAFMVINISYGISFSEDNPIFEKETLREKYNKNIELNQSNNIICDPVGGKINYLWDNNKVDITSKGNEKVRSVYYSMLPYSKLPSLINENKYSLSSAEADSSTLNSFANYYMIMQKGIFGSGIGKSGIITADIDNDGAVEIIAGGSSLTFGSNNFWYVLKYSDDSQEYEMEWISSFYASGGEITSIAAFDSENNGMISIFIGLMNGDIHIYDGVTLEEKSIIDSPAAEINRILYTDADNDAVKEILCCDDNNIFLYNATSLILEHQIPYGANDCEVGNVDSDSMNEIVLSNGLVLEFDGTSVSVEWDYPGGDFGALVELSDIDSDNMEEIIGASSWYYITAFDADIQSPKWQISTSHDIDALVVQDVDNDNIEEIIYGDGQWGAIQCYDSVTLTQRWEINNPDHGVTNITLFDIDADNELEILWGAGASSTGADHMYIHEIPSLAFEWRNIHIDGPFHALDVGDVDSDGQNEIVFASFESNSGYNDGIVFVYDALTYALEWKSEEDMFGGHAWTGIHDLKIADIDDDNEQEIVVATDKLYDGALYIINGQTYEMEHSYQYDVGAPIYSVAIADIDKDGQTEIIAGGGREHTGAPGVYVYIIDGSTGIVEWHSINLGDYWSDIHFLEISDIDGDGVLEIIALKDFIFVIDGITHQQWQSSLSGYSGLDTADIDNDGINDIVVGTGNGDIVVMDGQSYEEKLIIDVSSSVIEGLRVYDTDQNGSPEIIFSSSGMVNIYSIQDSMFIWQSPVLAPSAGANNSIAVSDIDLDGLTEIIIGTNYKVIGFRAPDDENEPPEAVAGPDQSIIIEYGTEDTEVILDGSGSYDPDGTIVSYLWEEGYIQLGTSAVITPRLGIGIHIITLTVTDNDGLTDQDEVVVTVIEEPAEKEVFFDDFETAEWNGLWTEDTQNDWFRSSQRSADGNHSAEVAGKTYDGQLISIDIDLQRRKNATITFFWYIDRTLDKKDYLAFDISLDNGNTWVEKAKLRGNVDEENIWHNVSIEVTTIENLKLRFRGKMSHDNENANVDVVRVVAW